MTARDHAPRRRASLLLAGQAFAQDAAAALRTRPTAHWEALAAERDLPLAALAE